MRYIILFIVGAATAYWLGQSAHTLTQTQRYIEMAVIFAVFLVIGFAIRRRRPAPRTGASPYTVPAKRR